MLKVLRYWKLLFLAVLFYYIFNYFVGVFDYKVEMEELNVDNCYTVKVKGPEDFERYGDKLLISSNNYINKTDDTWNGIYVLKKPFKATRKMVIKNFPKNVSFHPHGLSLFENKTLYVINH